MDRETKNELIYWIANMFSAITGVLLIFFATLGIILNYNLPEKLYLFKTISIRCDIIIFFFILGAAIFSFKVIKANVETEAVELWLKLIENERKKKSDR